MRTEYILLQQALSKLLNSMPPTGFQGRETLTAQKQAKVTRVKQRSHTREPRRLKKCIHSDGFYVVE